MYVHTYMYVRNHSQTAPQTHEVHKGRIVGSWRRYGASTAIAVGNCPHPKPHLARRPLVMRPCSWQTMRVVVKARGDIHHCTSKDVRSYTAYIAR
jgi:hypothetical protein